jgi:hypothetical protein
MSISRTVIIAHVLQCLLAAAALAAQQPRAKVGAYYFDGWSGQTNSIHLTDRLKTEFASRQPIWGWLDNTLPIMQQQIDLAADHGIAFFSFCWYWPEATDKQTPLNNALGLYLQAKNRDRLEFCLLVANHGGYRIGPNEWEFVTDKWIELFKQPGHLKVDGKPLLIFFSARELKNAFGSSAGVHRALDRMREKAVAAGLKGVCVAGCCTPGPEYGWDNLDDLAAAGFDLFTGYNYPGAGAQPDVKQQTFASLIAGHEGIWESFARKTKVPYVPAVTTGWDMRPWEKPDLPAEKQSIYYPDRTPQAVGQFIEKAIDWLDRHPDRTLPERMVLLYAWNENGEGGYLTPTRADGDAYLRAVEAAVRKQSNDR